MKNSQPKELEKIIEEQSARLAKLEREIEIEAALERVRVASMAMHHTDELGQVVEVLFRQLSQLKLDFYQVWINIFFLEEGLSNCWFSPVDGVFSEPYTAIIPLGPFEESSIKSWRAGEEFSHLSWRGLEEVNKTSKSLTEMTGHSSFQRIQEVKQMDRMEIVDCNHKYGVVALAKNSDITESDRSVLKRFTKVFEQTYTRFLDLKKAEAQAREAQIETALERVRARTMGMHRSNELLDTAQILFHQMQELGIGLHACGFSIPHQDFPVGKQYLSFDGTLFPEPIPIRFDVDPYLMKAYEYWKKGETQLIFNIQGEALKNHLANNVEQIKNLGSADILTNQAAKYSKGKVQQPQRLVVHHAFFKHGTLFLTNDRPIDNIEILIRFAKVFDQTYTRFLDLQKAEAQAREAQIEAALERIRAASMAMHHSSELPQIALVLVNQMGALGIAEIGSSINIINEEEKTWKSYSADQNLTDGSKMLREDPEFLIDKLWLGKEAYRRRESGEDDFTIVLKGDHLKEFIEHTISILGNDRGLAQVTQDHLYLHFATFDGFNVFVSLSINPFSKDEKSIIRRLTDTFGMSFRRFRDLQKAEAQAREAQIEAALERVRARTMAMHNSSELAETASVLFQQLFSLGIKPGACAFSILNEQDQTGEIWISSDGNVYERSFIHPYHTDPPQERIFEAWRSGKTYHLDDLENEELTNHLQFLSKHMPIYDMLDSGNDILPKRIVIHAVYFSQGFIGLTYDSPQLNHLPTFIRFAKVFEQTYTRFLDLQKAEAQAREAQIEAALERVRSASMAMHHSDDIGHVLSVLYAQLQALEINPVNTFIVNYNIETETFRLRITDKAGNSISAEDELTLDLFPVWKESYQQWKSSKEYGVFVFHYKQEDLPVLLDAAEEVISKIAPENRFLPKDYPKGWWCIQGHTPYGWFGVDLDRPPTEEELKITPRFSREFGRMYQRFLDLQKAEAQAREAQIEAALERVRARSMAMHKSDELADVVSLMYAQIQNLGFTDWGCAIVLCNEEAQILQYWYAELNMSHSPEFFTVPLTNKTIRKVWKLWKEGIPQFTIELLNKEKDEFTEHMLTETDHKNLPDEVKHGWRSVENVFFCYSNIKNGFLEFIDVVPFAEENLLVYQRFAKVFEQTYTRFLDLQKAEAQAKEAQIEAALERVRSRSMAMHSSNDLQKVITVVMEQFELLGFHIDRANFNFYGTKDWRMWLATPDYTYPDIIHIPYIKHPMFDGPSESIRKGGDFYSDTLTQEELHSAVRHMYANSSFGQLDSEERKRYIFTADGFTRSIVFMKNIMLTISKFSSVPYTDEQNLILKRFAKVFEQAYIRFLDLQKAEAQAREAQIEVALERIRSSAMAMHSSEGILEVTQVLRQQIALLGEKELESILVHIYYEDTDQLEAWYSYRHPENTDKQIINGKQKSSWNQTARARKDKEKYHEDESDYCIVADYKMLKEWYDYLLTVIPEVVEVSADGTPLVPDVLYYNYSKFEGGALLLITNSEASDHSKYLLRRAATVFNLAYSRFLDLQKAEAQALRAEQDLVKIKAARKKAEETLEKLKSTQSQLIQAEKMASLGELTAGIAHEIQNPLNFVNNFSEVSNELIDEVNEELDKGDIEEVKYILRDIKGNLEKINHHGKRADAIVKGMLQHSRTSTGQKEPTDINALCDEYLRLAYHGLRAKDSTFNADFSTEFDPDLPKVNVIPQDIGRVLLNLINNAFYAVNDERMNRLKADESPEDTQINEPQSVKSADDEWIPKVSISTKQSDGKIEITVTDNGPGIPESIKDKIFQPFFTTKPTGQGTGLGLSLSYDIVRAHGGELKVETPPAGRAGKKGEGSQFFIILPYQN